MRKNDTLQTPKYLIEVLGPFDLDPCAGVGTTCAYVNWTLEDGRNGLTETWNGYVWCNPPFSEKETWINKFIEHGNGILILPERGSAPWFTNIVKHVPSYFVMGKKINFIGGSSSNNVGSVLFPLGDQAIQAVQNSGLPGHYVTVKFYVDR